MGFGDAIADALQVGAILGALNVEEETIREIVRILTQSADDVQRGGRPPGTPASAFGGSESGKNFGWNVDQAHAHVVGAMSDLVAGLEGYATRIRHFHEDIQFTDQTAQDDTRRTTVTISNTAVPTLDQVESCTTGPGFGDQPGCTTEEGHR